MKSATQDGAATDAPIGNGPQASPLEQVRDQIGRLASLSYTINKARDDEHRHWILREIRKAAVDVSILAEEASERGTAHCEPEHDPDCPFEKLAAELFGEDRGGRQRPEAKTVTMERAPDRWRIFVPYNGKGEGGDHSVEYERRSDAMRFLKLWAKKRFPCPAIAVGPGAGKVTVQHVGVFSDSWRVWRAGIDADKTAEHVAVTEDRKHAMRLGKRLHADAACAIIATPYRKPRSAD